MSRIRSKKGMTLAETLAAVLIMSLVTLAIAAGVTAGMRVYRRVRVKAESQTLLATNIAALNDYIERGAGIQLGTDEDGSPYIDIQNSEESESRVKIYNKKEKGIYIRYLDEKGNNLNDDVGAQPLISAKTNTSGLYARISDLQDDSSDGSGEIVRYKLTVVDQDGKDTNTSQVVVARSLVQYPITKSIGSSSTFQNSDS